MGFVSLPPLPPPPPPAAVTDTKAIVALGLGVASLVTVVTYVGGVALGIPAIVLGAMSRRDVARSGGSLRGGAGALAGLLTGVLGVTLNVVYAVGLVLWLGHHERVEASAIDAVHAPLSSPALAPLHRASALASPAPTHWGGLHVDDLRPEGGTLRAQLAAKRRLASVAGVKMMVMTTASWSRDYQEVSRAMAESEMEIALAGVWIVRIDADEFGDDLSALGMDADVPSFFLVGASLRPIDGIGTDEWESNDASSVAPVLRAFVGGTLTTRVHPTGTATRL